MRKIWLAIAHTSGARTYGLLIGMATMVITARWLGPEGRGIIAATTTWVGLFSTIGHLSLGQVALYYATKQRNQAWLSPMLSNLLFVAGVITALGWVLVLILYVVSHGTIFSNLSPWVLLVGFLMLPLSFLEIYCGALLMAIDCLSKYNNGLIISRSIGMVLILGMMFLNGSVIAVLFVLVITQSIASLIWLRELFYRAEKLVKPDWLMVKKLIIGGLKLHSNALGVFMVTSTDVLIINYYYGLAETGYYQLAIQLMSVLLIVPQAASKVLYSKISQVGPDEGWRFQRQLLLSITGAMILVAIFATLVAPWIIPMVVGEAFAPAVPAFQWLLLALIGMTFSTLMAVQWIGRGLFWQVSIMSLSFGGLNLVMSLLLVPHYGMFGSIWGTLGAYGLSVIINGGMAVWCERRFRRAQNVPQVHTFLTLGGALDE